MKTSSCKQKGRNYQKFISAKIIATFPGLTDRDVVSTSMGKSGADIQLSTIAHHYFPYYVECKNQERISIWEAYDQACEGNTKAGGASTPILFIKRNRTEPLAVVSVDHFFDLLRRLNEIK